MDLLISIGKWEYGQDDRAILGPALITALVLPSPDLHFPGRMYNGAYTSLCTQDLTDITPLTRGCYLHD